MSRYYKNLSKRIRDARIQNGLSQTELAEKADVSQPTVANWESGHHVPRPAAMLRLARVLNVDEGWLIGQEAASIPSPDSDQTYPVRKVPVFAWPNEGHHIYSQPPIRYITFPSRAAHLFALTPPSSTDERELHLQVFSSEKTVEDRRLICLWTDGETTQCTTPTDCPPNAQTIGWLKADIRLY